MDIKKHVYVTDVVFQAPDRCELLFWSPPAAVITTELIFTGAHHEAAR